MFIIDNLRVRLASFILGERLWLQTLEHITKPKVAEAIRKRRKFDAQPLPDKPVHPSDPLEPSIRGRRKE